MRVPVLIDRENRVGFNFPGRPLRARSPLYYLTVGLIVVRQRFSSIHSEKGLRFKERCYTDCEKNGLVELNSNSDGKLMNQNFLVKSRTLVEIIRILIDIIRIFWSIFN